MRGRLSGGGDLPQIPPLRLLGALEYDHGQFHAAVDVQWFDEQSKTARDESPTDGGTQVGAEVSWLVDAWQPNLLVFLRGTNLLDEELRRHSSPLKDYVPLPGASVLLGSEMIEHRAFYSFVLLYGETDLHELDLRKQMIGPYYRL